ncbi:hypothetical protein AWV79_02420 [Cupriavidus sp. UYMMa02A]|nr:hypothetical protein AWV79_02420 [Cupriavidus sp. UYMMa02A]
MLNRWLGDVTAMHPELGRSEVFRDGTLLVCTTNCHYVAAFHIVRYLFEGRALYSVHDDDMGEAWIENTRDYLLASNSDARLCIRAAILGLYATIIGFLGEGGPLVWDAFLYDLGLNAGVLHLNDMAEIKGFIAFQSVPGMPMWPFDRTA